MIFAMLLSLCVCMSAMALEINTKPLYTYETNVRVGMVDHHDRLVFSRNNVGAMAMPDGTVLTDAVYRAIYGSPSYYGLIKVSSAVNMVKAEGDDQELYADGLIDESGKIIVPAEYQWINILNSHWALGGRLKKVEPGEEYDYSISVVGGEAYKAIFTEYDIYYVDEAKLVATVDATEIKEVRGISRYLNIEYKDGSIKSYNTAFECVAEPDRVYGKDHIPIDELDPEEPAPERIAVPSGKRDKSVGAYGLYAPDGKEILAPEWDSCSVTSSYGFPIVDFSVKKDGVKYEGVVSAAGKIIFEPTETDYYIDPLNNDYARIQVSNANGKFYGVIDAKGNMVVPAEFKRIDPQKNGKLCLAEREDGIEIWSLTKGRIDVGAYTKNEARILNYDTSVLVEYKGTDPQFAIVSGEGKVTKITDAKSIFYVSNSKGEIYRKQTLDRVNIVMNNEGKTIMENYSDPIMNDQATMMVAKNDAENRYEFFEVK